MRILTESELDKILYGLTSREIKTDEDRFALLYANFASMQAKEGISGNCELLYSLFYYYTKYKASRTDYDAGIEQEGFKIIERISIDCGGPNWEVIELIEKGILKPG